MIRWLSFKGHARKNTYFLQFWKWKCLRSRVPLWSGPGEDPLLGFLTWWKERTQVSLFPYKGSNLTMGASSPWLHLNLITSPKTFPLYTNILEIKTSAYEKENKKNSTYEFSVVGQGWGDKHSNQKLSAPFQITSPLNVPSMCIWNCIWKINISTLWLHGII